MKHAIPTERLGPLGVPMAHAVQACVHCGFCLPTCPTYQVLGQEMDSPRGRIVLMKDVLEGRLSLEQALPHIDACLGCLACETACPSGVLYRDLISPFRDYAEKKRERGIWDNFKRFALLQTLPYPRRFRVAARLAGWARPLARLMPRAVRPMFALLPKKLPPPEALDSFYPADGPRRARVALLSGCVQPVLAPEINQSTVSLLTRNGVEVVIPPEQGCCGSLGWHIGEAGEAREKAAQNLVAFPFTEVDAIITNAAGCGSGLREYPLMLRGTPLEEAARAFAAKVRDICQFLDELGIAPPPDPNRSITVAYHDACHLAHGQGVWAAPRRLLHQIPGLVVKEISDPEVCCGSAGTYNIDQPETAAELGRRKAAAIMATGAEFVVTGNIGCLTQLQAHLPPGTRIMHTVELLDRVYRSAL
ncbi:MAG: (Fe-S)-binding protein [Verrucomicrobiales bacterium]